MKPRSLATLVVVLAAFVCSNAAESPSPTDWPLFRGNVLATGVASSTLPDELDLLWTYTVEKGAFESTPVVADGVAYLGDLDGHFFAIHLATGKEKWKTKQEAGFNASAAFRDGLLFVGDIDGVFHCFSAADGSEKWHHKSEAEINSAPNFYKENVLFGSQDGTLYAAQCDHG